VTPIIDPHDGTTSRFTFDIAMGVRRDDASLRTTLDQEIARQGDAIRQILRAYGVPLR